MHLLTLARLKRLPMLKTTQNITFMKISRHLAISTNWNDKDLSAPHKPLGYPNRPGLKPHLDQGKSTTLQQGTLKHHFRVLVQTSKGFFWWPGVRRLVSFLLTENGLVSHTWWRMRFEKYPFGCRKFKGIPLKTNMSPETNGWFRCILYWHSTFFSGTFVSFRGIFSCRCSSVWKANSSTKRSTTSKVSNLRNFRSTNVFKCLGEMQGFWCHNRLALKQGGYDWIHNTKVTPYNLGGWEILGSRWLDFQLHWCVWMSYRLQ